MKRINWYIVLIACVIYGISQYACNELMLNTSHSFAVGWTVGGVWTIAVFVYMNIKNKQHD